ncbi:MAG: glycosyltransferase [Bacteroidia bacterium]
MKKVLFIAYQYPPKGGPGVHRSLNFSKYLLDYGYKPYVFTIKEEDIIRAKTKMDNGLLAQVPSEVEVIRVPSHEPLGFIEMMVKLRLFRLFWVFLYPLFWEYSALWPFYSYKKAKEIIEKEDIKLVYTSSGPFAPMILGYLLQKRLKMKWVADLRDPFTDAYAWQFPTKFHWYLARLFEKWIFSKPDKLIVNTPEVEKLYLKRKIISPDKITHIVNGF